MKKVFSLIVAILLFTSIAYGQFTTNASINAQEAYCEISFAGEVDSLGGADSTLTSQVFSLEDYDAGGEFTYWYEHSGDSVIVYLQGSRNNSDWTTIETLVAAGNTTHTQQVFVGDYDNKFAKYYRLYYVSADVEESCTFDDKLYLPAKDASLK